MRKLIDLKDEEVIPLKKRAIDAGLRFKNYLEKIISDDLKKPNK